MELLANGLVAIKMMVLVIFVADRKLMDIQVIHVLQPVQVINIMLYNMVGGVHVTIRTQPLHQRIQERTTMNVT